MSDADVIRQSLAQLATGTDPDRAVIETAHESVADLERAATFVDEVGVVRLARAVERQRQRGADTAAARGAAALSAFRRFQRAASGGLPGESTSWPVGATEDGPGTSPGAGTAGEDRPTGDGHSGLVSEEARDGRGTAGEENTRATPSSEWRTLTGDQFHSGRATDIPDRREVGAR